MKRFCFVILGILLSCLALNSCSKDKITVPDPIFRMIEAQSHWGENCFDCDELYQVDEYLYKGDRVFMFIINSGGWTNLRFANLYDSGGFEIGKCYFNDECTLDKPYYMEGCYEDFIKNGQYIQTIWSRH